MDDNANKEPRRYLWLALLAALIYSNQATRYVLNGTAHDLLWMCNIASATLAFGFLIPSPRVNAFSLLWLMVGTPMWIFDVLGNAPLTLSGTLVHLGGIALGLRGVMLMGYPKGVWWQSLIIIWGLQQLSKWVTPPANNVNLSHGIWAGSEAYFSSYFIYLIGLYILGASMLIICEKLIVDRFIGKK